uniref:Non-specific lipid-transfer protein n=1 Tax=Solanum tuberosum TaxID=4113 RepID=M1DPJ0_SOLTU
MFTMLNKQLFPLHLLCIVVATATSIAGEDATITCNLVYSSLEPCLGYVLGGGGLSVPSDCCSRIRSLHRAARTTTDRQIYCRCLKNTVGPNAAPTRISRAIKLPTICNVNYFVKVTPILIALNN